MSSSGTVFQWIFDRTSRAKGELDMALVNTLCSSTKWIAPFTESSCTLSTWRKKSKRLVRRWLFSLKESNFELSRQVLHGKTLDREIPEQEAIKNTLYTYNYEPYKVKNELGLECSINEHNAVSIVTRYCSSLYNSRFTNLVPIWKLFHVGNKFQVILFSWIVFLFVVSGLCTSIFTGICATSAQFTLQRRDIRRGHAIH